MRRVHSATIIVLMLSAVLLFIPGIANAQRFAFGSTGTSVPSLPNISPPYGNPPVARADLNGDGISDIVILGATSGTQGLSVFMGRSDGTFAPAVNYPIQADGMAIGDFNGDGKLDVIVISAINYPVSSILIGNGDGTFQAGAAINLGVPYGTYSSVAAADLNGDNKPDLVLVNRLSPSLAVLLGNGDTTFAAPVTYPVPITPYLAIADLNGDGRPELVVGGPVFSSSVSPIAVLINSGDGTFQAPVSYTGMGSITALALAEVNHDNKLDLITFSSGSPGRVSVLLGSGDGTLANPIVYTSNLLGIYGGSFAIADFDDDGNPDVAVSASLLGVIILSGNGDGTFKNPPQYYGSPGGGNLQAYDANGDGKPDLVGIGGALMTVAINQSQGAFVNFATYPVVKYPWLAAQGDFNGDGKPDIVVGSATVDSYGQYSGGVISVLLGKGDGSFQPRIDSQSSTAPTVMATGDFNGDGRLDVVTIEAIQGTTQQLYSLNMWLGNGDGTFQHVVGPSISYSTSLAVGDFNRDGKLDLATETDQGDLIWVFLGRGDGTFAAPASYSLLAGTATWLAKLTAADFNGDGKLDMAVATNQGVSILPGNGDGTFGVDTQVLTGFGILAVGDFNGDGKPDIFYRASTNGIGVALNNGDKTFTVAQITTLPALFAPGSPIVSDFNGDGKLDVAVFDVSDYAVAILFGTGDGTFTFGVEIGSEQVGALVAADFNGDGAIDLAATDVAYQLLDVYINSPVAAFYPQQWNFGQQPVGSGSRAKSISVENPGPVPISISAISTLGDFAEMGGCMMTLAPGTNCQANVTFTPTVAGVRTGAVVFEDNVPGSPQMIALAGTGTGTAPFVSLSPNSLTFDAQLSGTTSSPKPVTLSNTGNAALSITTISATTGFSETNNCGSSLAAGANCTINVTFKPTAGGNAAGTLAVTSNALGSPQSVTLSGTGEDFNLSANSGSSSQTVTAGQKATYNLTIGGLSGMNQAINFACTGAPTESICNVNPASVTPSGSSTVALTVSVSTTAASQVAPRHRQAPPSSSPRAWPVLWMLALMTVALLWSHPDWQRRWLRIGLPSSAATILIVMLAACGGSGGGGPVGPPQNTGTPSGTYTLTVTGTVAGSSLQHSTTLTLKVS